MSFAALSVKGRALRYLSQREHSRVELERKLARHVQDTEDASAPAQIAAALDDLAAKGLLSEARTAESVLNSQGRRYGVRRLKQTLQGKGLAPELVASTLQQARGTELERAQEVWRRRFGEPAADAAERARQMRFLAGRGFEGEVIRRVVRGAEDEHDA
jgi:regulatory protein